jgi:hypothetical protein
MARIVGLVHIGTNQDEYQGEAIIQNKIRLTFELPEELHQFKDGDEPRPIIISQEFTLSMGEKANLRKLIEGVIGHHLTQEDANAFNVEELVNMACLVVVKHKTSGKGVKRAEISSASPLMKGQTCKPAINPLKVLTYEKWDEDYFNSLPDFLKEKMQTSDEYKKMKGIKADVAVNEVPFP